MGLVLFVSHFCPAWEGEARRVVIVGTPFGWVLLLTYLMHVCGEYLHVVSREQNRAEQS